jgi:disulfide bond formation protein DsbB
MTMDAVAPRQRAWLAFLNSLYLLLMLLVITGVLTAAMFMQYVKGELPCPLCLLQRVCMLGVCFGIMHGFRFGFTGRNAGVSMLFATLLLVIATRQTLLDIYPRPGHAYIGTAIFGIHMPVWSILIALALLIAYAVKFILFGGEEQRGMERAPAAIAAPARILSAYVVLVALINFGSVLVQCELGECHTFGYKLLQ